MVGLNHVCPWFQAMLSLTSVSIFTENFDALISLVSLLCYQVTHYPICLGQLALNVIKLSFVTGMYCKVYITQH